MYCWSIDQQQQAIYATSDYRLQVAQGPIYETYASVCMKFERVNLILKILLIKYLYISFFLLKQLNRKRTKLFGKIIKILIKNYTNDDV